MPRRIFSFDTPDRFICGALGQPGQRTFYLQAAKGKRVVSVALEKAQVAVLAERLATLLLALRQGGIEIGTEAISQEPKLDEPVVAQFRVGTLTLGWDSERERVVIEARELTDADDEEDDEQEADEETVSDEPAMERRAVLASDLVDGPDVVLVQLELEQALSFATGAVATVQAGRPPCPNCGQPLEPTGHFCPRRNGYTN
jgi:uncharacterized repeat protein (TIGR03847 family)